MTIGVLAEKGQNHCQIARQLGVVEGTVRYHLRRAAAGAEDGRRDKPERAESVAEVIAAWHADRKDEARPVNVADLHDHLVAEHGYEGSYQSVRRYVRRHYPPPKVRTYRRIETSPGAQSQTDWAEYPRVDLGDGPEPLSAFVMRLSHSRKTAVVWSRGKGLLAWLGCHNRAYERLAGVAAVNRIDNVKTAVAQGAGPWGTIHPAYRAYSRAVGFEQRSYAVPFQRVGRRVEVRGCAGKVQILAEGRVLCEYPRHSAERVLIDPSCYEGEATDRVEPPRPLGKMAQRLQAIYEQPVEQRPLDLYAALAEVAR